MDAEAIIEGVVGVAGFTSPNIGFALAVLSKLNKTYTELQGYDNKCAVLHRRLNKLVRAISKIPPETSAAKSLLSRLISLIKKFDKVVNEYSEHMFLIRWAYMGKFDESINNYNAELDHIITMAKSVLDSKTYNEIQKYCTEFEKASDEPEEATEDVEVPEEIKQHFEEMKNKKDTSSIARFVMELKRNYPSYQNNQEPAQQPINSVIQKIIDFAEKEYLENTDVETPPTWMITEDEVVFGEQIDSRGATRIYIGEWGGVQVAIKKFSVPYNEVPVFDEHLQIWRTLLHPNVAQLYGAGSDSRCVPFFVYEYARRRSLNTCWESLSLKKTWKMLYQAALGLTYLHKNRIVHGNLSCSKFLVTEKGNIKLFGFGASYLSNNNQRNTSRSKIHRDFAAPECLGLGPDGEVQKPRFASDVYSLGITIMEAVGKQNPFKGYHEDDEMEEMKLNNMLPRPRGMDEDAWTLVNQMCVCDPSQRVTLSYVTEQLKRYAQ